MQHDGNEILGSIYKISIRFTSARNLKRIVKLVHFASTTKVNRSVLVCLSYCFVIVFTLATVRIGLPYYHCRHYAVCSGDWCDL